MRTPSRFLSGPLRRAAAVVVILAAGTVAPVGAMDTILLKNGTRITGKILGQSKSSVFMRVGTGNAVYSKKAIRRIYEDITDEAPVTRVLRRDELPPWWVPLSDLYHEDWVNSLKAVPAGLIDVGDLKYVPYLSFRANGIYEMNIYGDPRDPAGLEIGYRGDLRFRSGDAQKRCRQFIASYLGGLRQFEALYRMNRTGGRQEADGLTIQITPRGAADAFGGWWVVVWNPQKLAAARRRTEAEWKAASERNLALILKSTEGAREWTKYSLQDAAKRYLPLERMEER